jgi:hypothetical protein
MATDSTTAGYLLPTSESPVTESFDDVLQSAVVGITGLAGPLVRPRWQPEPPNQPDFGADWCALGTVRIEFDGNASQRQETVGDASYVTVERDQVMSVLHSFYGPNARLYCERMRAGLELGQNRDVIVAAGLGLVAVGDSVTAPMLMKERWVNRIDVTITYRRRVATRFAVATVLAGDIGLNNELYLTPILARP